jgi:hypothetical protein
MLERLMAVGGGDAGRLLPAMLQRVEAEIDLPRRFGMAVDRHDAAFFAQLRVFFRGQGTGIRDQGSALSDSEIGGHLRLP